MQTLEELNTFIQSKADLKSLKDYVVAERSTEKTQDSAHGVSHFLRVALWTVKIGGSQVNPIEAIAAALLHDIVNIPKNSPLRKEASRLCAEKAQDVLPRFGFNPDAIERISDAIRCHSFSRGEKPKSPLACALQDADRLEALGSIGIMRCVATGVQMGADFFHPDDPLAQSRDTRDLDDAKYSIDHFYTKLLKLPQTMTTNAGRAEAQERADTLRFFLSRLGKELGITS